jgi:hypothetical protein
VTSTISAARSRLRPFTKYESYTARTGTLPPQQRLSVAGSPPRQLDDCSCDASAGRPAAGCRRTTQGSGGMAKQSPDPQASPPSSWDVYRQAHKAIWLGIVVATDERDAIEKVAKERNIPANRLIATRRRS